MNLARHAAVVWRFRGVAASGLALGILLAVLASYQVGWKSGPSFTPRGEAVWTAVSQIQVTQRGFPEGRTTLPADDPVGTNPRTPKKVQFGDPGRLGYLADYYSKYMTSEVVLGRVAGKPSASQISASPFLAAAGGQLPIIELTANADSDVGAKQLNLGVFESLRSFMEQEQATNGIASGNRVEIRLFVPPRVELSSGRSKVMSVLALVLCLVGTLAIVHLLEALRGARSAVKKQQKLEAEDGDVGDDDMAVVMPWTASAGPPSFDEAQPERVVRSTTAERTTAKTAPGRRSAR